MGRSDPSLLDKYVVPLFNSSGTTVDLGGGNQGQHALLFGNWDCVLSVLGNTVVRSLRGAQRRCIYVGLGDSGNTVGFNFSATDPSGPTDAYTVPAGAGFFGQVIIGNNILSATDGHVVTAPPTVDTKVPMVLFNNRGLDEQTGAVPLRFLLTDGTGAGEYELQGVDEGLEAELFS